MDGSKVGLLLSQGSKSESHEPSPLRVYSAVWVAAIITVGISIADPRVVARRRNATDCECVGAHPCWIHHVDGIVCDVGVMVQRLGIADIS